MIFNLSVVLEHQIKTYFDMTYLVLVFLQTAFNIFCLQIETKCILDFFTLILILVSVNFCKFIYLAIFLFLPHKRTHIPPFLL